MVASAFFDVIAISTKLNTFIGGCSSPEIHLFAYLACLLTLFDREPISNWGYGFIVTENGNPFGLEIEKGVNLNVSRGNLEEVDGLYTLTKRGKGEYSLLSSLGNFVRREKYLEGSCSSLAPLPLGYVRQGIKSDEAIRSAIKLEQTNLLFTEASLSIMYTEFAEILDVIGSKTSNLIIPSSIWLSHRTKRGQKLDNND